MSLKWVERGQIDGEKWALCAASSPQTDSVFTRLWYLDACCEHWSALVEDDYRAVLPLFWRKKYGIFYIYPPFFVAQIGILGRPQAPVSEWLRAVPHKYLRAEIIFNASNNVETLLSDIRHRTCLLSCRPDYETLRSAYHQNHRRNLRKAEAAGLHIVRDAEASEVIRLFRENRGQRKEVGYKEADYARLQRLTTVLQEHGALEIWGVTDAEGRLCAAAFFAFAGNRYTFLFSGRDAVSDENRSMFLLVDRFLQAHAGSETLLDFNGSNNEAVAKFYLGFGAESCSFVQRNLGFFHFFRP